MSLPSVIPAAAASESSTLVRSLGEGDTVLLESVLSESLASDAFDVLLREVKWEQITQQGKAISRLVSSQGVVDPETGARPIYRKPLDSPPDFTSFTPTIARMCTELNQHPALKCNPKNTINHCYLQLYQDGNGFIGSHSDKTLDIAHGSDIVNLTLYAPDNDPKVDLRRMVLKKKQRQQQQQQQQEGDENEEKLQEEGNRPSVSVPLPHNSALVIGPLTNTAWLHGVPRDTISVQKQQSNKRMSLVFRTIATFITPDGQLQGQGAPSTPKEQGNYDMAEERQRMYVAFGVENRQGLEFDWQANYGTGFACTS